MNGFTNGILSLLLGWFRSLASALWALFGSEGGGTVLRFLQEQWKAVFLILCVGGFLLDRVIYLLRWRPYYVWQAKRYRRRMLAQEAADPQETEPVAETSPVRYAPATAPLYDQPNPDGAGQTTRYRRPAPPVLTDRSMLPGDAYIPQTYAPSASPYPTPYATTGTFHPQTARYSASGNGAVSPPVTGVSRPRDAWPQAYSADARPSEGVAFSPEADFAPTASYRPLTYSRPIAPEPFLEDLRFDEDPVAWYAPQDAFADLPKHLEADRALANGVPQVFGQPQPEPEQYLREMRAVAAQQPAPAHAYPPRPEVSPPEGIHPGLDRVTFQQNIGLSAAMMADDSPRAPGGSPYPGFAPFPDSALGEETVTRPRGLGALAKRARTFVSGEDERNPRSIRDLQPTVDVKSAFRPPVYPKKSAENEDDS